MKITKRDLSVIMILAGVLIAFLTYQMYFTKKQDEIDALCNEQTELKRQIKELEPIRDNVPFYNSEMERFNKELGEIVKEFPADVKYEDGIMYVVELEDNLKIKIPSFTVNEAVSVSEVMGSGALEGKLYTLSSADMNFGYTVKDYDEVKSFADYIYSDEEHKRLISNINMVFDKQTGNIAGAVTLRLFSMTDGTNEYVPVELPEDNLGVDCIFGETEEAKEN